MMFSECIVTRIKSFIAVLSLQELCSRAIVATTSVYGIEHLPLPQPIKSHLKSYTNHNHTTRLRQLRQVGNFGDILSLKFVHYNPGGRCTRINCVCVVHKINMHTCSSGSPSDRQTQEEAPDDPWGHHHILCQHIHLHHLLVVNLLPPYPHPILFCLT